VDFVINIAQVDEEQENFPNDELPNKVCMNIIAYIGFILINYTEKEA